MANWRLWGSFLLKKKIERKHKLDICKNIYACLFSVHNIISLSRHEQVCLIRLRFERYFSHHRATLAKVWERFVDDVYSILKRAHSENFFHHINNLHQNIKFTMEEENNGELAFDLLNYK